ncbi:alpha/beta hydrolase [Xanthobacter sp. V3C-3]|uniref:alpha/beta hydrolase n=1 Tax=Xanthobacter lutulentifluminis TaxID=3119935 RepID=UPI0037274104
MREVVRVNAVTVRLLRTHARRLLAPMLLLALAACARPEGVLVPVEVGDASAAGAGKVDMLVATTRAPSETEGVVFTGERGGGLALTNIVVSIPPGRPVGSIQWPSRIPADPAREFAVTRVDPVGRPEARAWFQRQPRDKRRVLVFVHGFNTRFDASVFRFAQFVHDTGTNYVPVLFTWPSRGRVTDYIYDRESANFSRSDLAYVLEAAAKSPHVDEVVVLAHSMGAWLAMESLRQLALSDGRVPAKITNVVLASPDLDIDVFERQMQELGPKRPQVTIFVSRNDSALGLSRLLAGQVQRVGAVDLSDPAYSARLEQATGIVVLDLTALQGGDALNHSKFATQPDMVRLLGDSLASGQSISDDPGPATSAVQTIGGAVGTVVTAPIQVFTAGR